MSFNQDIFTAIFPLDAPHWVRLGDDRHIEVKGRGTVTIIKFGAAFTLTNVLYVPALGLNLLSVTKTTNCGKYSLLFSQNLCDILRLQQSILQGPLQNGLYLLRADSYHKIVLRNQIEYNTAEVPATPQSAMVSISLNRAHQRMGHIHNNALHKFSSHMASDFNLQKTIRNSPGQTCEACVMGKLKETCNSLQAPRARRKLELIHSDLAGALPESLGHAKYFIIYIDDYSRYVWFYPLLTKAGGEIGEVFHHFKSKVECKSFPVKICRL